MVDPQVYGLGALAGFTIFLGLPIARLKHYSPRARAFLNSLATGILLFLFLEIVPSAQGNVEIVILGALKGTSSVGDALVFGLALLGGFGIGLLTLVWYEGQFIRVAKIGESSPSELMRARRLALMIAAGIGLHNFSEGLAIGQQYASGLLTVAYLLIIGFGAHNATEGFGIGAPLTGFRPSWRFLAGAGLIGGGPTFLGTVAGSAFVSPTLSTLFLALAGGALLYVILTMFTASRRDASNQLLMTGIFLGFIAGYLTDLILVVAGA